MSTTKLVLAALAIMVAAFIVGSLVIIGLGAVL